jgi:hypothetical protein
MLDIWISGHMGAPYTCVWNEFTIRDMDESLSCLNTALEGLPLLPDELLTPGTKLAYELIKREIPRKDFWFKKLWYVNLPDVKNGYAVLTFHNEKFLIEGRCCDLWPNKLDDLNKYRASSKIARVKFSEDFAQDHIP